MRVRRSLAAALLLCPFLLAGCSGEVSTSPAGGGSTASAPATASTTGASTLPTSTAPTSTAPTSPAPSSPETPATPPDAPATTSSATGADQGSAGSRAGARCTLDHLHVAVGGVEGGGAAGSVSTAVLLSNTGTTSCTLQGYPGVSFVAGEDGEQVGAAAERDDSTEAAEVELEPGDEASAVLRVLQHGVYSEDRCDPTDARGYRIYPPGETAAAFVAAEQTACASQDAALLSVGPVVAGPPHD